jgi:hypothetical protein
MKEKRSGSSRHFRHSFFLETRPGTANTSNFGGTLFNGRIWVWAKITVRDRLQVMSIGYAQRLGSWCVHLVVFDKSRRHPVRRFTNRMTNKKS